jgi:hypothetical protein
MNSIELSGPWEAVSCTYTQKCPNVLCEPEVSLPSWQQPSTGIYPKPDESSPCQPQLISLRSILIYRVFQEELHNDIPNVTVWRVLRKRLDLKAYKLSVVQGVQGDSALQRFEGYRLNLVSTLQDMTFQILVPYVLIIVSYCNNIEGPWKWGSIFLRIVRTSLRSFRTQRTKIRRVGSVQNVYTVHRLYPLKVAGSISVQRSAKHLIIYNINKRRSYPCNRPWSN